MKTRATLFILTVMVSLLLLTSCGQKNEPTVTNTETDSPEVIAATAVVVATEELIATEAVVVTDAGVNAEELMNTRCTTCHALSRVTSKKATIEQWQSIVERMVTKGAVLTEEEQAALIEYLAANYK